MSNSWSVDERTRCVDFSYHFLRELKDMGLIQCRYVPGPENNADIFTKNVAAAIFEKHIPTFVGVDGYTKERADTQRLDTSKEVVCQKACLYSEVRGNWCMGRDSDRDEPWVLYGLREHNLGRIERERKPIERLCDRK